MQPLYEVSLEPCPSQAFSHNGPMFSEAQTVTFSILLCSLTSTFICRQANASYRAPFPKQPYCAQKNLAALIPAPSLSFHSSNNPFSWNSLWRSSWHRTRKETGTAKQESRVTLIVPSLIKPYLTPVLGHHLFSLIIIKQQQLHSVWLHLHFTRFPWTIKDRLGKDEEAK